MDDPLIRTMFEHCLGRPLDASLRLMLADRLEESKLSVLAAPIRQSLAQNRLIPLSRKARRAFPTLHWACDGWLGLDASLDMEIAELKPALVGAIRIYAWDEPQRMLLKRWRPSPSPAKLTMIPGGPLYPHLAEILGWPWCKKVSILVLRKTYPGKVGLRALARSGGALRLKILDLRSNLLSASDLELLSDWPGLESLERLDLRDNPGDFREWVGRITKPTGRSAVVVQWDQESPANESAPGMGR